MAKSTPAHQLRTEGNPLDVREIERFLYHEAALLDDWRLEDWLELLTEDAQYLVPSLDTRDADPRDTLFLVADDRKNIVSRVRQLLSGSTWSENPRSRTRRLVSNVRVLDTSGDETRVTANFTVWRFQMDQTDAYVGRYMLTLVRGPNGPLIRLRRVELDHETLRPHGKLSFIL
jgi:p-cumate 2,3-dioxygenase subunit beta